MMPVLPLTGSKLAPEPTVMAAVVFAPVAIPLNATLDAEAGTEQVKVPLAAIPVTTSPAVQGVGVAASAVAVVAVIAPLPMALRSPVTSIATPFAVPSAVTCKGRAVEPAAVLILNSGPVRALPVVSVKEKTGAVDAASAPAVNVQSVVGVVVWFAHVNAVVSPAGMVSDNAAVGAVIDDQGTVMPVRAVEGTQSVPLNSSTWPVVGAAPPAATEATSGTPWRLLTTVALCVPVTSPARGPVKVTAVVAEAARPANVSDALEKISALP
jgi:hypothetical protein